MSNIPYASTFFNIAVIYANHEELIRYWQEDLKIELRKSKTKLEVLEKAINILKSN